MLTKIPKKTPKKEEVSDRGEATKMPLPPKPEKGKFVMRMIYKNGKYHDITCERSIEAVSNAMALAEKDGFDFTSAGDVVSWERVA